MGVLERDQRSMSSKHFHPGGEFGFVIEGALTMETQDQGTVTLEEGSSFHQQPGKWHVISTSDAGAKTILVRARRLDEAGASVCYAEIPHAGHACRIPMLRWIRRRRIEDRSWPISASCSTQENAVSLAVTLLWLIERLGKCGWRIGCHPRNGSI